MSIRALALELYRAQQKVEQLEARLADAPYSEQEALREKLREARAEWKILRNMLNGEKSPSPYQSRRPSTFKRRN